MNLYILDSEKLVKYQLPTKVEEDYSISYKPYGYTNTFLITLEARDGNWIIKSNGSVNVMNNEMIMEESFLQKYYIYPLKMVGVNRLIYVYAMPAENDCIFRLSLDKINQITVGNAANNNISYNNPALGDFQLVINKKENFWEIDLVNVKFAVYINNNLLKTKTRILKYGDVIFIYGLKIIVMKDFIEINNPNNQVGVNAMFAYNDSDDNTNYQEVSEEDKNVDLYSEDDYFFHTPTIKEVLEEQEIKIDTPPDNQNEKTGSVLMTVGMSITMLSTTFMMGYSTFTQIMKKDTAISEVIPQIVMLVAMVIGTLLIPTIVRKMENRKKKKMEKKRQILFSKYLEEKEKEITATIANQKNIINTNSPTSEQCKEIISKKGRLFWSRELSDNDFLDIRLGIGTIKSKINISAPEQHFELETDNLMQKVYDLCEKYKMTDNFPTCINLTKKKVSAIVCGGEEKQKYVDSIIMQLITLHSPIDLKLCFITNEDNYNKWEYATMIPHCWNATKDTRLFATNIDEAKETSWNFSKHPIFKKKYSTLNNAINDYINNLANINEEIMNLEEEVNLIFNQIYGFNPPRKLKTISKKSASEIIEEVISFVVGVVFNRYNVDNYELVINNKEYVDIEIIEDEIRKILTIYFGDSATKEIETYLGKDLNSYLTNRFWKYHLNDYNNLPIYWYKAIDDKLKIGYYHTLKDIIDKEKGIKTNYLNNHLYYKLK